MPKPNLFIIGAMKAGTSSLHAYLGAHPQIFMSEPKEPAFFEDPAERRRPKKGIGYWNDLGNYLELFDAAGKRPIIGESTTDYTKLPQKTGVARRIFNFNPDARLIYLIRDPIVRTISHYWWEVRTGEETRSVVSAITYDNFYRDVSNYAMQLEPYLELFPREQLRVITFEELITAPGETLQALFRWLGVDSSFRPANLGERFNVTPRELVLLPKIGFLRRFRQSSFWDAVGPYIPRRVRLLGRKMIERRVDRSKVAVDTLVDYLRPIQIEQTALLSQMLNRSFPEWKCLYESVCTENII